MRCRLSMDVQHQRLRVRATREMITPARHVMATRRTECLQGKC